MKSFRFLKKSVVCLVMVAFFLVTCSKEEVTIVKIKDHEYLPLQVGLFQIYSVTETTYTTGPIGVTRQYDLKMEIKDSLQTSSGAYSYVIYRSTRDAGASGWTYLDTWTATFSDKEAVVQEANVSYVKIMVPIELGRTWNGNLYNSQKADDYSITKAGESLTTSIAVFPDVIEITQNNEVDTIVGNDIRFERYARGVGLIYRKQEVVTYCSVGTCIGKKQIQSGTILEQTIKEYGKN